MVSPFFLPESGAPSVCLQLAYLFYVVLHLLFESAQPNFSVKPTPTSFACRFPACFALRCGLPAALGLLTMLQRIVVALLGLALVMYEAAELYALPTGFGGAAHSIVQGVPSVTSQSSRASLYFPRTPEAEAFQTSCYLARAACDWVRKNPGVSVKAKVARATWPFQSWLITMSAANDFMLDSRIQEQELVSFRRRTIFGLVAIIGVTISLWFTLSRRSEIRNNVA